MFALLILSFSYSIFKYIWYIKSYCKDLINQDALQGIVKMLKQWSQSAGNKFNQWGTSETIRFEVFYFFIFISSLISTNKKQLNETVEKVKKIVPIHNKPNYIEFGHYLAGLIESDGHFSNQNQLIIVFNSADISLAYFIKSIQLNKLRIKMLYFKS